MSTADLPLSTPQIAALRAIDVAVETMDHLVGTMPDRVLKSIKAKRGFGASVILSEGHTFAHIHTGRVTTADLGVYLQGAKMANKSTLPFHPTDYGPKPEGVSAHAYLNTVEVLKAAWAEADKEATHAARMWAKIPGMERVALTLSVAPRPHLKGIRAAVNLRGRPIEIDRHDVIDPAQSKDWYDEDGPRDRLIQFLSLISGVRRSNGVWAVTATKNVAGGLASHRAGRTWDSEAHLVDAGSAQDAATIHQAYAWVDNRRPYGVPLPNDFHAAFLAPFEDYAHG